MGARYVLKLYLGKNHKIPENATTIRAREKISTYLESLEIYKFLMYF